MPLTRAERTARARAWRHKNPDKVKAAAKRYRRGNPSAVTDSWRKYKRLPKPSRPEPEHCECCGRPFALTKRGAHLDHCHTTGTFRGWLCITCNIGIGGLGDCLDGVRKAVKYLETAELLS